MESSRGPWKIPWDHSSNSGMVLPGGMENYRVPRNIHGTTLFHLRHTVGGHHNCIIGSKVTTILLIWCKDYSALRHCRNRNHTAESPQISTRRPQTPGEAIVTLCAKCAKQEVFESSHFVGKIEGSQKCVVEDLQGGKSCSLATNLWGCFAPNKKL